MTVLRVLGVHSLAGENLPGIGIPYRVINPTTGENLEGDFYDGTPDQVDKAMQAADSAYRTLFTREDGWQADFLEALATAIDASAEPLIARASLESALPEGRLKGELVRTTSQLQLLASVVREGSWVEAVIDSALPERKPVGRPDIRRMQMPLGPVVVFDAVNFPFAFGACGNDTAAAVAAGCPVVVKSHPSHAGTDELFANIVAEVIERHHLPRGLFSLVHGKSNEVSRLLVEHPCTAAIGFTGSFAGGSAVAAIAAARTHPIPVFAEMGSINPLFILPGALKARPQMLAEGLHTSVNLGVGQFCTKPGVVFAVEGDGITEFTSALHSAFDATTAATMLNKKIRDSFVATGNSHFNICGVVSNTYFDTDAFAGVVPWILQITSDQWRSYSELHEEAFGPGTIVVTCENTTDILQCARAMDGQLTASIQCELDLDGKLLQEMLPILANFAGRVVYNGFPTGVEVCHAMVHGGPHPATTSSQSSSVGTASIIRFTRPVCMQNVPDALLPRALQRGNPQNILRQVNGQFTRDTA